MWQLFPLHQKAVVQLSMPDVFTSNTPPNKSFGEYFLDKVKPARQ